MEHKSVTTDDTIFNPGRRKFAVKALQSAVSGAVISKAVYADALKNSAFSCSSEANPKPAVILRSMPTDQQLTFARQAGAEYVEAWMPDNPSYVDIKQLKQKVEDAGLSLWSTDILEAYNSDKCIRGVSGRDEKIKQLQNFIHNLGKAGIHTTTLGWGLSVGYSTGTTTVRGGCSSRKFDAEKISRSLLYDREYSEEEIWGNLEYFLKNILPVAEDSGVRLAFHPCDPPISLRGCPNILSSNAAYKRLLEIGNNSAYIGTCFCVGTWAEMAGPEGHGEDIIGAIHQLGADHIYNVHFRNVSSPLPTFHETFIDDGYINMYRIIKAFLEVGFHGTLVPDHVPGFSNEVRMGHMAASGTAYSLGAIRMALLAAQTEIT